MDIGFQLFSARNFPLADVLKKIGTLGYTHAEGGGGVYGGVLPWPDLLETVKSRTSAQYFIVEHDNPSDIERFASRSIAAIENFGA